RFRGTLIWTTCSRYNSQDGAPVSDSSRFRKESSLVSLVDPRGTDRFWCKSNHKRVEQWVACREPVRARVSFQRMEAEWKSHRLRGLDRTQHSPRRIDRQAKLRPHVNRLRQRVEPRKPRRHSLTSRQRARRDASGASRALSTG